MIQTRFLKNIKEHVKCKHTNFIQILSENKEVIQLNLLLKSLDLALLRDLNLLNSKD